MIRKHVNTYIQNMLIQISQSKQIVGHIEFNLQVDLLNTDAYFFLEKL